MASAPFDVVASVCSMLAQMALTSPAWSRSQKSGWAPRSPPESKPSPIGSKPAPYKRSAKSPTMAARRTSEMLYDVVIVGGGPSGLSAALTLGRARKRVLLCDSGPRRNAAAEQIHNFVTRDGTPPDEFRHAGRRQLSLYSNVEARDLRVESISGARGAFQVRTGSQTIETRRIVLCTGMFDDMLPIDGFRELWGRSILQCPYCHGWEIKDRRWGYLGRASDVDHFLPFALMLRGWTSNLVVFTDGSFELPDSTRATLKAAGIQLETEPLARLVQREGRLEAVEL